MRKKEDTKKYDTVSKTDRKQYTIDIKPTNAIPALHFITMTNSRRARRKKETRLHCLHQSRAYR